MSATVGTNNRSVLDCHCYAVNAESGTFLNYVTQHKAALIGSVQLLPREEAAAEIELALSFMQHYMRLEDDGLVDKPESKHRVLIDRRKSPFEILLDLHSSMRATCVGFKLYFYGESPITGDFIKLLLQFPSFSSRDGDQLILTAEIPLKVAYCTMVVFDSADLDSASDRLAAAWSTNDAPWAIRSVLVQENIKDEFVLLVKSKLKPFTEGQKQFLKDPFMKALAAAESLGSQMIRNDSDSSDVKPTLAFGVPGVQYLLSAVTPSPIVVVNAFRTAKEAISLVNGNNGGSVSLWTEELSLTFEVAYGVRSQTVWVNSYAEFNPDCPYTFRAEDFCYGSDYAVCEKKVKTVFAPSETVPTNSGDRNRAAIKSLGTYVADTRSYRGNTVQMKNGVHYETISSPADIEAYGENHRLAIADKFWDSYVSLDAFDRRFLLDTVYNQRKVICIPFGVTFAN
ncbi:AGAP002764-PA-like protein [Anopheles sinensis]|uniref:AGAP002764-PA-like protein n=1 Tax=Anopheles sinensis TaxID=74873 RepID=A0A084W314_ANOSI|nr:AGAP002764-PA-like protein [Anopheles sinensis]